MTIASTPSQRRYQRTRQQILEAAQIILDEQGVAGLSMRSLAEKVDYSPAALYKYFTNKEEIIAALCKQGGELSAAIQQRHMRAGMNMAETFTAMFTSYLEFARTYPALYELITNTTDGVRRSSRTF
jgi:AcrR family transcriptional regulator